jgi:hypothetical protein
MKALINKLKSKVLTYLFKEWVENEFELETLEVAKTLIVLREKELKGVVDLVNRVKIKGYKRYSGPGYGGRTIAL